MVTGHFDSVFQVFKMKTVRFEEIDDWGKVPATDDPDCAPLGTEIDYLQSMLA